MSEMLGASDQSDRSDWSDLASPEGFRRGK